MTDSRSDIGAPYPARRGMADRPEVRTRIANMADPALSWHVRCLLCRAAGIFYHEGEAHDWAEAHRCPPKDAA